NGRWICQPPREFPIIAAEADNPRDNRRPVTLPKLPTKAEIRAELEAAVDNYLQTGGEIQQVARGVSGREDHRLLEKPLFDSPKTPRTYVNDLIARIESRRRPKPRAPTPRTVPNRPRWRPPCDDSGDPIRRIGVDESPAPPAPAATIPPLFSPGPAMTFIGSPTFRHDQPDRIGVLL